MYIPVLKVFTNSTDADTFPSIRSQSFIRGIIRNIQLQTTHQRLVISTEDLVCDGIKSIWGKNIQSKSKNNVANITPS